MAQQTAVEFYNSKIKSIIGNWTPIMIKAFEETFIQAKQMEKEQIINAYKFGLEDEFVIGSEKYYNQIYNK